jgi:hypothetical protein
MEKCYILYRAGFLDPLARIGVTYYNIRTTQYERTETTKRAGTSTPGGTSIQGWILLLLVTHLLLMVCTIGMTCALLGRLETIIARLSLTSSFGYLNV